MADLLRHVRCSMSPRPVRVLPTAAAFLVPSVWARQWRPRSSGGAVVPRTGAGWAWVACWLVSRAVAEEVVFRAWLSRRSGLGAAATSTVVFALLHWRRGGARAAMCQASNAAAWAACARANRSIFWPSVAHAGYNAAVVLGGCRRGSS